MKLLIRLLLFLPVVIAVPLTANATAEEYELSEYVIYDIQVLPEPETHPIPAVKGRYVGTELEIKLHINKEGIPSQVRLTRPLASYSDIHLMTFAAQMQQMVSQWKFSPAEDAQGNPEEVNVILPIRVVEKGETPVLMASLRLDLEGNKKS